jgi:ligand-binding sensor domain-containing protein/signal transduction histidine kinase
VPSDHRSAFIQSRFFWLFCLLCLVVFHPASFALDTDRTLTQYAHRIWGQEEGLAQPTVYSILQSRNGYLWLGTQDSLIRFDGVHFRDFDNSLDAQFQHSVIRSLLEDRQGNLWIGSIGSGLARLGEDGSFTRYTEKEGLPSADIFCLASDSRGSIWVCTNEGLAQWQQGRFHVFTTADGLPSNQIRSTCQATDGARWVAGVGFGVGRWSGSHFEHYVQGGDIPANAPVMALDCAKDGSVWVGTDFGLTQITPSGPRSFSSRDGLPDNAVSALTHGPDGSIWIGTHDGVSRYRGERSGRGEFSTYRTSDGLSHSSVLSLYFDHEGSLWAGTKNGLDQFTDGNVTPYTTHEGMPSNDAGPVLEDASGQLWVGTLADGLAVFDGHHFKHLNTRDGLADNHILSLELDKQNDIWVGTAKGLNRLHAGQVVATFTKKNGLSGDEIQSLFVDLQGSLWTGTDNGLDVFDGTKFKRVNTVAGSNPNHVFALGGGRSVRLFVGGDPGNLYFLKDNVFENYALSGVSRPISCYYLDHVRHVAWMGTAGSGLLRWQNGTLTHFRLRDGLYDNRIYSILKDDLSNFWFASSKGIFRVSEKDLEEFAAQKIQTINSIPFSTGQLRFECQSGVQPAAYRSHDGRLWFSTSSGLVVVDPDHLLRTNVVPPVHITSIFVNGQRLEAAQKDLKPWQKNLEIRYAGLSFVSPEKMTFRYMLEGYDKTWTEAGTRREAFFTNLPPGRFRFRVEARNADGLQSRQDASAAFTIQPLIYQRAWFWPLMAVCIALLITGGYRLRIRRLQSRFDLVLVERSRIARELHDTLLQGLSGITMQLQALWMRLPISLERDTLADIIKDAGRCSSEARQSLWGLRVIGGDPVGLSGNLTKLARQAVVGKTIALVLEVERIPFRLLPEVEFQLLRIAQESISNALRHAGAESLEVGLRLVDQKLEMMIKDDGDGFAVDLESARIGHFGLVGIRERAEEIGAILTVASGPGEGTEVLVKLPISASVVAKGNLPRLAEHQIRSQIS